MKKLTAFLLLVFGACGGGSTGGGLQNIDATVPDSGIGEQGPEAVADALDTAVADESAPYVDECLPHLNPQCQPTSCKLPDGSDGTCRLVDSECKCLRDTQPPGACELNQQCTPDPCVTEEGRVGTCIINPENQRCECLNPCDRALNGQCADYVCWVSADVQGRCWLDLSGGCACLPESAEDPCGQDLNPQCFAFACDDGRPETVGDRCGLVYSGGPDPSQVELVCTCFGDQVALEPCDDVLNPLCRAAPCWQDNGDEGFCQGSGAGDCKCLPEVTPVNPCGEKLNPKCDPKECWLSNGGVGRCFLDVKGCICMPVVSPEDPCSLTLNPKCEPMPCDDNNPATIKDLCRFVKDQAGNEYCKCLGELVSYDPCDKVFNPECKPVDCKTATGEAGKCQVDPKLGCACKPEVTPLDPCGKELNPECKPVDCWLADGTVGKCAKDVTGGCGCVPATPIDPCGKELNPECKAVACDDGNPNTIKDSCRWVMDQFGYQYCKCQGELVSYDPCDKVFNPECKPVDCKTAVGEAGKCQVDPELGCACKPEVTPLDPCGKELNPECKPVDCWLADGTVGKCAKDITGGCGCVPATPVDPCGKELNPECKAVACDDGNPNTIKDSCRWVTDQFGYQYCKCQGELVVYDPCDPVINPKCEPVPCELPLPVLAQCQKDDLAGCACKPVVTPIDPCSKELNPQCEPRKCAIAPNVDGLCHLDPVDNTCKCGGFVPQDPCSNDLNPQCKPVPCDDMNPLTFDDRCMLVVDMFGFKYCACVGQLIIVDPCGPDQNPTCAPYECKTASGQPGQCKPDIAFGCRCVAQEPGPCDFQINPQCKPLLCDDGDPTTVDDKCRLVQNPMGLQTCACQGAPVSEDPCHPALNPLCQPSDCVDQSGKAGKCGRVDVSCTCVAQAECQKDADCLLHDWLLMCLGHWDCLLGQCTAVCGLPCGNGVCEPAEGESMQSCPVDCGKICYSNDECANSEFCAKKDGDCTGAGVCTPRPTLCPLFYKPVCGCDGQTYVNACEAHKAGVNVLHEGVCDPCGSATNPECKPATCQTTDGKEGKCGQNNLGVCVCISGGSAECQKDFDCLPKEWLVDCVGHWDCVQGQCVAVCGPPCGNGICEPEQGESPQTCAYDCKQCQDNSECSKDYFCAKKIGDCKGVGLCEPRPQECPLVIKPVCGCDGQTYQNACLANAAGVSVWYEGECQGPR